QAPGHELLDAPREVKRQLGVHVAGDLAPGAPGEAELMAPAWYAAHGPSGGIEDTEQHTHVLPQLGHLALELPPASGGERVVLCPVSRVGGPPLGLDEALPL